MYEAQVDGAMGFWGLGVPSCALSAWDDLGRPSSSPQHELAYEGRACYVPPEILNFIPVIGKQSLFQPQSVKFARFLRYETQTISGSVA